VIEALKIFETLRAGSEPEWSQGGEWQGSISMVGLLPLSRRTFSQEVDVVDKGCSIPR
jgi:hypothetical protein